MFIGKWQRAVIRVWSYSLCIVNTCHKYLAILINRPSSSNKNENSLYFHRWKPHFSPRDQVSSCTFSQNLRDKSSCPQHPVLHNAIKDLRPQETDVANTQLPYSLILACQLCNGVERAVANWNSFSYLQQISRRQCASNEAATACC